MLGDIDDRLHRSRRLVHQRPGDAAGFALVDLRQRVGVVHLVILAAGRGGDVAASSALPSVPCEPTATVLTLTSCLTKRADRARCSAATGRRR